MNRLGRLAYRGRLCLYYYFFRLLRFGFRRFHFSDFRRLVAIQTPYCLLVEALFETSNPTATLFRVRHRFASLGFASPFGLPQVDDDFFRRRRRALRVREYVKGFGQSSALRPFDRVQAEIIALFRISTGANQLFDDVGVTEDYREDERSLAAARSLVDVSALGK